MPTNPNRLQEANENDSNRVPRHTKFGDSPMRKLRQQRTSNAQRQGQDVGQNRGVTFDSFGSSSMYRTPNMMESKIFQTDVSMSPTQKL